MTANIRSELLPKQLKTDLNRGMKRRVLDNMRIPVRVVEYRITNRESSKAIRLITTLIDPAECPATQLAALSPLSRPTRYTGKLSAK